MKKIFDLELELKKKLISITEQLKLSTEEKFEKTPEILIGYVPTEEMASLIPAITLRTIKGKNTLEKKTLQLTINIGIYEKDTEIGYKTLYDLIDLISSEIIDLGVLLQEFEILPEYDWELAEEQPYPFWIAVLVFNIVMSNEYRTDVDDWINSK